MLPPLRPPPLRPPRIRLLSETTVNRIAAGEVIERPAAAVKELVENALDAGARRISVVLRGGGIDRIEVTDDGCGMTAEELGLAVSRHATSKLADDDLVRIATLGFRGEALPSIGAAARLDIVSRVRDPAVRAAGVERTGGIPGESVDAGEDPAAAVLVARGLAAEGSVGDRPSGDRPSGDRPSGGPPSGGPPFGERPFGAFAFGDGRDAPGRRHADTVEANGADAGHANAIAVEGGTVGPVVPASGAPGTRIVVRDLFFATPARRKFLKNPRTEAEHAETVVRRLAMAAPATAFRLEHEGRVVFDLPAQERAPRVAALLGAEAAAVMLPVQETRAIAASGVPTREPAGRAPAGREPAGRESRDDPRDVPRDIPRGSHGGAMVLSGYICAPAVSRMTGAAQSLVVNGRPVADPVLKTAVRVAYRDVIAHGRHPVVALWLDLPPEELDVNVHPAKSEVRFRDPAAVRSLVIGALTRVLAGAAGTDVPGAGLIRRRPSFARPSFARPTFARPSWTAPPGPSGEPDGGPAWGPPGGGPDWGPPGRGPDWGPPGGPAWGLAAGQDGATAWTGPGSRSPPPEGFASDAACPANGQSLPGAVPPDRGRPDRAGSPGVAETVAVPDRGSPFGIAGGEANAPPEHDAARGPYAPGVRIGPGLDLGASPAARSIFATGPFGSTPFGPTPFGPTPSGPTPSGPTPSGPTPSGPTPSGPTPSGPAPDYPLGAAVAQVLDTYIVAVAADGTLILVDQHAAHERLTHEAIRARVLDGGVAGQPLLLPAVVDLPRADAARLLDRTAELARLGLEIETFGPGAVLVRAMPAILGTPEPAPLIRDIADELAELDETTALSARLDAVIARMACHGSIRAGRRLGRAEMDALLRRMEATPRAATCSHGRPTFLKLSKAEIESLFGRR